MEFIKPRRLIPGKSVIGLVAPSGIVDRQGLAEGVNLLKSWGFEVKLGEHVLAHLKDYSAGGEKERVGDLLAMIRDDKIAAIGCLVGGYAAGSLLKYFDCQEILTHQKIFFGYSDFSLILNVLFGCGMVSYHAPNVAGISQRSLDTQKSLRLALTGEEPGEIGPWFDWKPLKRGFAKGRLLVSNMEAVISLMGTRFDVLTRADDGLILALEEVGEEKATIFRWLQRLALHAQADKIKGIILGRFTKIGNRDYPVWGSEIDVEQIFLDVFGDKKIPIASFPDFGHIEEVTSHFFPFKRSKARERVLFWALPSGIEVLFKVKANSARLKLLERPLQN